MKLSDTQIRALTLLSQIFPGDPILDTALALAKNSPDFPDVPTLTIAIGYRAEDAIKLLASISVAAWIETPQVKVEQTPPPPPPLKDPLENLARTAQGKLLAWLRTHAPSQPLAVAPAKARTGLEMPEGTFNTALKNARDEGAIMAEGHGRGRRIWAK